MRVDPTVTYNEPNGSEISGTMRVGDDPLTWVLLSQCGQFLEHNPLTIGPRRMLHLTVDLVYEDDGVIEPWPVALDFKAKYQAMPKIDDTG